MNARTKLSIWMCAELGFLRSMRDFRISVRTDFTRIHDRIAKLEEIYEEHLALSRENAGLKLRNRELENRLTTIQTVSNARFPSDKT